MENKWYVIGGVYTDGTFTKMENGTGECFGPYPNYIEACQVQDSRQRRMIDTCYHKLFVVKLDEILNTYKG